MHQSKLIKLLKILSQDEFRLFYKFVRSIYYQNNTKLVRFYKLLRKYYPDFPPEKIDKIEVFQQLYPGRTYSSDTLASLMTKMTRLVEDYLLVLDLKGNDFERKKRLIQIYGQRNQIEYFEKGTKALLKELQESPFPDHYAMIALNHDLYFHPLHDKYDLEDDSLEKMMDSLDQYFTLSKIRYGTALKCKQKILDRPYELRFIDSLARQQNQHTIIDPRLFKLYQLAFDLLEEKEDNTFYGFEELFFEHVHSLNEEDQKLLYINGLNFINRQVNKGKSAFSSIAFSWYQYGLKNDYLIENQKIDQTTFGNIVVYGCREKQFDWTASFISNYQSYLEPEIRHETINYNQAWLHISKKEFDKALPILNSYPIREKDQPKTRFNIIRALFELFLLDSDYHNLLMANIHSFEVFISRNSFFNKSALLPYLNGIRIIRGLAKRIAKNEHKEKIKGWFSRQTQTKLDIIARSWMLEKINEC